MLSESACSVMDLVGQVDRPCHFLCILGWSLMMQVVGMARFGQKQQRWGLMKARWERGLRLEASERLYVMRSGQQSVLDAAQRRRSGAVADASSEYGQIWPKAAKVGA